MESYGVRCERTGSVAVLTLDRPERRNAMNEVMWDSLEQEIRGLEERPPRALIVTGAGHEAFCAGFDVNPDNPQIKRQIEAIDKKERGVCEDLIRRVRDTVTRLGSLPVPVIAAVNGLAYGGGAELAVRCDIRVADPGAVICFSEVRLGLMPDWGGGVALARLIGQSRAADLILTARKVKSGEAQSLGLVNRVSAPGRAREEALELAGAIAGNGPRAVRYALEVIRRTPGMPLAEALDLEAERAVSLILSGECVHGIGAFLAKQEPRFPDI